MSSLQENFLAVDARIRAACKRAGRDPSDIRLIWVSKNHPQEKMIEARSLGARIFGENKVQEAQSKFPLPPDPEHPSELHFIGRLQKNKIRKILPLVTTIHSVDSVELLEAVDRVAGELGVRRDVFLQVNTSREEAKGGFHPENLLPSLRTLPRLPNVRLVGLMTMGPAEGGTPGSAESGSPGSVAGQPPESETDSLAATRACFRELAGLLKLIRAEAAAGGATTGAQALRDMAWLSMGMTGDFELAVEEGAHFLRVGTGLFGSRVAAAAES